MWKTLGQHRRAARAAGVLLGAILACSASVRAARIKDVTTLLGVRKNQLYGFGLVVGLAGTGGGDFTGEVAQRMLEKLRVARGVTEPDPDNMAAVMVTADLPGFAREGTALDVTVSALDKSDSLRGGTLLLTPLKGADGNVYAVAQGPLSVGGYSFGGEAAEVQQGHPTVGRIPGGATVERTVLAEFLENRSFTLCLDRPDFTSATRIAAAVEENSESDVTILDAGTIRVALPRKIEGNSIMEHISHIQGLPVTPDARAVVVINERTGTVVAGQNVTIAKVAISHGSLTVITRERPVVSQPLELSGGTTEVVPRTDIGVNEPEMRESGGLKVINRSATVGDVARALNMLGVKPSDLIAIFQAMKQAGALHAELKIL